MDAIEEKEAMKEAVKESRIIADVLQSHEKENKRLWTLFIVQTVIIAVLAICFIWHANNVQRITNEAITNAIEQLVDVGVTRETTTTTTQTVDGENATINNVEGEQYNDNAQKVVGGE